MSIQYACGKVLNNENLIIISKIHTPHQTLGLASAIPEAFIERPSLHFLSPSWWIGDLINDVLKALNSAITQMPLAQFVFLANDEQEAYILNKAGVDCIIGNSQIFINENTYKPIIATEKKYEALYNSIFSPFKNHQLCKNIQNLALIHQRYEANASDENRVRHLLPQAKIINEASDPISYIKLTVDEVCHAINQSYIGLSLSEVDGACNETMEYLLCGTPVVSVRSKGGKDRFLTPDLVEFADPNPDSVMAAITKLRQKDIAKNDIREIVHSILLFERNNFLRNYNQHVAGFFGDLHTEMSIEKFIDCFEWKSHEEWLKKLECK